MNRDPLHSGWEVEVFLDLLKQKLTDDEKLMHARALLNIKPLVGEPVTTAQTRLLTAQWLMAEVQLSRMADDGHTYGR